MRLRLPLLLALLLTLCLQLRSHAQALGTATQYTIVSTKYAESIAFWEKLGFKQVANSREDARHKWVQLCDESLLITLSEGEQAYSELSYLTADYKKACKQVKKAKLKPVTTTKESAEGLNSVTFESPDGFLVSLSDIDPAPMYKPTGKNMLELGGDVMDPAKMPSPLGALGEISICVKDIQSSIAFWEKLGFKGMGVNADPYPWTIMNDGMGLVGLHQTTDWTGVAITYFAPDMGERIAKVRAAGIEAKEMGMGPNNVVVVAPDGTKLFLFSFN